MPTQIKTIGFIHTFISMTLLLFLLGLFLSILFQIAQFTTKIKESSPLIVELENNASADQQKAISSFLNSYPGLVPQSLEFISREQAFQEMKTEVEDSLFLSKEENPFPHIFSFSLVESHLNPKSIQDLKSAIEQMPGVAAFFYQKELMENVGSKFSGIVLFLICVFLILVAIALFFAQLAIKAAVLSRTEQIQQLKFKGHDLQSISSPFLTKAWQSGLISAILASICLLLAWYLFSSIFDFPYQFIQFKHLLLSFIILLIAGPLIQRMMTKQLLKQLFVSY